VDGLGVIGSLTRGEQVKHDSTSQDYPYREHPVYLLWNSNTARLQCIMIGEITEKRVGFSSLMALRTAATSGVGFRHLARKDSKIAGVFGAGGQALHKVLALQNE
jgi:ornithine cyclodeaminase/alanine dehydrogenase-like protein (mu-crystallin family)